MRLTTVGGIIPVARLKYPLDWAQPNGWTIRRYFASLWRHVCEYFMGWIQAWLNYYHNIEGRSLGTRVRGGFQTPGFLALSSTRVVDLGLSPLSTPTMAINSHSRKARYDRRRHNICFVYATQQTDLIESP